VASLAAALSGDAPVAPYALVMTDYFGGVGEQWACAFVDGRQVVCGQQVFQRGR